MSDNVVEFNQQRRILLWNQWLAECVERDKANPDLPSEHKFLMGMSKGKIGEQEHEGAKQVFDMIQEYVMENAKARRYTVYDLIEIVTPEDEDGNG